jgi:hypothetical protein
MRIGKLIGIISAVITIFVFTTGIENIKMFFLHDKTKKIEQNNTTSAVEERVIINKLWLPSIEKIYFLDKNNNKNLVIKGDYTDVQLSPTKRRIAVSTSIPYELIIINVDGTCKQSIVFSNEFSARYRDVVWVNDDQIRLYISTNSNFRTTANSFILKESGTYLITIDTFNTAIGIDRVI